MYLLFAITTSHKFISRDNGKITRTEMSKLGQKMSRNVTIRRDVAREERNQNNDRF